MANPTGKNQYSGGRSGVKSVKEGRGITTTTFKSGLVMMVAKPGYKPPKVKPLSQKRLKAIFNNKYG